MKKTLLASALLLAANSALAGNFGYTYVEGGFGEGPADGDGVFLGGAVDLQQGFGLIGSYYALEYDDRGDWHDEGDLDILTIGAQFHTPINSQADFVGSVQLMNAEWDCQHWWRHRGDEGDDTGLLLRGGIRFAVQQNLQLEGDISYITNDFWDDNELGIKAGLRFFVNRQFSIAGGIASDQELDGLYVSGRFQF